MTRSCRTPARFALTLACVPLLFNLADAATPAPLPATFADGWHSWRVAAVNQAPAWCCVDWNGAEATTAPCRLDDNDRHYANAGRQIASPAHMQVYARFRDGRMAKVHALAPQCPVHTNTAVVDHGTVAANASAAWIARAVSPRNDSSTEALAAIAVHAGDTARRTLLRTAVDDASLDNRKDAVFWMGQVRAQEFAQQIRSLMFDDAEPAMREHAAFSWSRTELAGRADALIELGRTDRDAGVRSRAWFWLAQTGEASAETALMKAVRDEAAPDVRQEVIFALSQLPGERAVDALVGIVEDPRLPRELRQRAIFWVAQSESERALEYVSRVLEPDRQRQGK